MTVNTDCILFQKNKIEYCSPTFEKNSLYNLNLKYFIQFTALYKYMMGLVIEKSSGIDNYLKMDFLQDVANVHCATNVHSLNPTNDEIFCFIGTFEQLLRNANNDINEANQRNQNFNKTPYMNR